MKTMEVQLAEWENSEDFEVPEKQIFLLAKTYPEQAESILNRIIPVIKKRKGIQAAYNLILRVETALGVRKPTLAVYDNALHFVGGAQKYGLTLALALQDEFEITLIGHKQVALDTLKQWYDLDLSRCRTKTIPLPYFEKKFPEREIFDAGAVDLRGKNPFHAVSRESGRYDFFVNNCMLEMVYPLANYSQFICHFPERERSRFFHTHRYSHIIFNSLYTAEWIRKRWELEPHIHIYPPVDIRPGRFPAEKKPWILSVSRFEPGGNKQQMEIAKVFLDLKQRFPKKMKSWRLILAGGSIADNPYLEGVKRLAAGDDSNIDIHVNVPIGSLQKLYRDSALFWHFSGLGQSHPERIEHFGMTTVEAMQNGCVPVVYKGGGQKEIVSGGRNGLFFTSRKEAASATLELIKNKKRRQTLAESAFKRGKDFSKEIFIKKVRQHFLDLLKTYRFED